MVSGLGTKLPLCGASEGGLLRDHDSQIFRKSHSNSLDTATALVGLEVSTEGRSIDQSTHKSIHGKSGVGG
jgi:hypothetical protein